MLMIFLFYFKQLQSLVADNSVDLTAKFAELAASIAAADANASKSRP